MTRVVDWLVIGSGPAGCAATAALLAAGVKPVVVDGGVRSSPRPGHKEVGSRSEPGRKAWFGSTDVYTQPTPSIIEYRNGLMARASYAQGGFSRVWGATAELPMDWADWPKDARPQHVELDLLRRLLPRSKTGWGIELECDDGGVVPGSNDSLRVMDRVKRVSSKELWEIQPSTVAIETERGGLNRCRPCGQCLEGCPRNSIWFAGDLFQEWSMQGELDYRPGILALSLSERGQLVEVQTRDAAGRSEQMLARRVLVGAGPISSSAIALKSGMVDNVLIQDTATAFTGVLSTKAAQALGDFHHGLAQWWIRDRDERVLAQVYPPSIGHAARLANRIPAGRYLDGLSRQVTRHVHPIVAYLCQEESDAIHVSRLGDRIIAEVNSTSAQLRFAARLRELAAVFHRAGYWLPAFASEFTPAGTGYHMGSSWPHGAGSDSLGRLPGSENVHFIDASVLPGLRVGSITPTVMINAMRIARQLCEMA